MQLTIDISQKEKKVKYVDVTGPVDQQFPKKSYVLIPVNLLICLRGRSPPLSLLQGGDSSVNTYFSPKTLIFTEN